MPSALFSQAPPFYGDTVLSGELWWELEPLNETAVKPISAAEAMEAVLKEAVYVFSGMIYGFSFLYTPSDRAREVKEIFILEPQATIPWGDPALKAYEARKEKDRYFVRFRYACTQRQEQWMYRFNIDSARSASGTGKSNYFLGPQERPAALREAIKEAIRESLRNEIFNKPKEIRGEVILSDVPKIGIVAGNYQAQVRVRVVIKELVPYHMY